MPRLAVLCLVLCLCGSLGALDGLPRPGWPQPLAEPSLSPPAWARAEGELRALAADGTVRWRRELLPGAQLWPGRGGTLLADARGLRWLQADGSERVLPPLPVDVLPLGVDGEVAFFAQGAGGWRLNGAAAHVTLPDEPLGTPLADGHASLWLTAWHLVWWDGSETVRHRHGLPAGRGWSLARAADGSPLVLAPDGHAWAIPPWQSGDDDERLGLPVVTPAGADRATRMRHALMHQDWPTAAGLAVGTAERAALALYADWPPPPGCADLAPIPCDPGELLLPEPAWRRAVAPRARAVPQPTVPTQRSDTPLLDAAEACRPADSPAQRNRDGVVVGLRSWLVEDDGERTTAVCRDDGRLRWYVRWVSAGDCVVPGRSLALESGRLIVSEGDAHLIILDAEIGTVLLDVRPRRLPLLPGRTWPLPDGAVVLYPPGRDDRLGWFERSGAEHEEFLPAAARWLLALPDGEVWLSLVDGRTLAAHARGTWLPINLPTELAAAREVRLVDGGVAAGERCWRWRE